MDTELYSIGAFFCDEHPELVDEVIARSEEIERRGLEAFAAAGGDRARADLRDPAHRARGAVLQGGRGLSAWVPRVLGGARRSSGSPSRSTRSPPGPVARSRRRSAASTTCSGSSAASRRTPTDLGPDDAEIDDHRLQRHPVRALRRVRDRDDRPAGRELRTHRPGADRVPPLLARPQRRHGRRDRRRGGGRSGAPVAVPRHLRPQPRRRPRARARSTRSSCARWPRRSPSSTRCSGRPTTRDPASAELVRDGRDARRRAEAARPAGGGRQRARAASAALIETPTAAEIEDAIAQVSGPA